MNLVKTFSTISEKREQLDFLHMILDSLPIAVFCKDADEDMRVLLWNKTAEKVFGIMASEIIGRNVFDVHLKERAEKYSADDFTVANENKRLDLPEIQTKNKVTGEKMIIKISKFPIKTDNANLVVCIAHDLTELKKAEVEHRDQERHLANISNNIPGLIYQFKADSLSQFSFTFFSQKVVEVLGVTAESVMRDAQNLLRLIHEDDLRSYEASLVKAYSEFSNWKWEGRLRASDESIRWFRGVSTPTRQEDGSSLWDGILLDITAQKEAEELIKAQEASLIATSKLVALGEMAGGVAHEINTPLNSILFCAEQINTSLTENSFDKRELHEMSGLILETSQRISKIVKGLKAFARDGELEPLETADLETVIDQSLALCGQRMHQNGINLEFVKPTSQIMIQCRSVQLGQVVLNLLNNAFDAVVGTQWPWIKIEIKDAHEQVRIEVTDSGGGLSREVKAKLFQPFFTTKEPGTGTGIGLSISQGIIQSHGGKIFVDERSSNTKFVIELPRLQKAAA